MSYDPNTSAADDARRRNRSRGARPLLAVAIFLAIALAIMAPFDRTADPDGFASPVAPLLPSLIGLYLSPFARDAVWGSAAGYDEFERDALRRATTIAWRVMLALVLALSLWCWTGALFDFPRPLSAYDWSAMIIALCVTATSLPALIAEGAIPIPPPSDAEGL